MSQAYLAWSKLRLVFSILTEVIPVAEQALVVREPDTMLLGHRGRGLLSTGFRVVRDLGFASVPLVRASAEQAQHMTLAEVPQEPTERSLILQREDDVSELHGPRSGMRCQQPVRYSPMLSPHLLYAGWIGHL